MLRRLAGVVALVFALAAVLHGGDTHADGSHGAQAGEATVAAASSPHAGAVPCEAHDDGSDSACPATASCAFCAPIPMSAGTAAPVAALAAPAPDASGPGTFPVPGYRPPRPFQNV
jgi:hypothetical protein